VVPASILPLADREERRKRMGREGAEAAAEADRQ
jgi:hypothetical protein